MRSVPDVADEELIARIASGCLEALDVVQERYRHQLTNVALRRVDRPSAEELVQDVFLSVWQHAGSFDPRRGPFRAWIFQIARHRILNELRHKRARPSLEADPEGGLLSAIADETLGVVEQVARHEQGAMVRRALHVLPVRQREAVAMAFLAEMTQQEVASALDVPLGTAKTRIRAGLHGLRTELGSRDTAA